MAFKINDNNTKSTDNRNSRYVQGGTTEIYNNRTGWWERRTFERQDDDIRFIIGTAEARRPDAISNAIYGKATYAWLILEYNNIVDIETELLAGAEIFMPTQERLILDIITRPTGGRNVKGT
jgi:hypothetical protein